MTAEAEIEGEAVEVKDEKLNRALVPQSSLIVGGTTGLALMSEEAFEANIAALKLQRTRVDRVKEALMVKDVDYGVIPGTKKPALLKPGAETLLRTFGLADSYVIERIVGDGEFEPHLTVISHARIHVGDTSGPVIAEGVGAANTWETKHRYRGAAARTCPDCGKDTVIHLNAKPPTSADGKGRPETWWCGTRDGGCGHSFAIDSEKGKALSALTSAGKVENPDPYDLENTVTKMSKKRSLVDGILTATGTSSIFTQDEDAPGLQPPRQNGASAPESGQGAAEGEKPPSDTAKATTSHPDGPAGLQGVVNERPDGIRMVRLDRPNLTGGPFEKFEVRFKVDSKQHTAMLIGEVAKQVEGLALQTNEVIRVVGGAIEEVVWSEDKTKPKKKELWGATAVAVLRDGEWWSSTATPSLGFGQAGPQPAQPSASPTPTASSSSETSSAAATASSSSASPSPTSSGSSATTAHPTSAAASDGEVVTIALKLTGPIEWGKAASGVPWGILRTVDPTTGEIIPVVLGDDPPGELAAQLGTPEAPAFTTGDAVTVVGTWRKGWIVVTAVGKLGGAPPEDILG